MPWELPRGRAPRAACKGVKVVAPRRNEGDSERAPSGRVRWRSRRGQRELDLLLERYLDTRYTRASDEERRAYALLLEQPDPDILEWVLGREEPPPELSRVVRSIAAYH